MIGEKTAGIEGIVKLDTDTGRQAGLQYFQGGLDE